MSGIGCSQPSAIADITASRPWWVRSAPVKGSDPSGAEELRTLIPAVEGPCSKVDLRRIDCHNGELHASLLVEINDPEAITELLASVQQAAPGATVSVVDHAGLE